jgi:hypothetical protein
MSDHRLSRAPGRTQQIECVLLADISSGRQPFRQTLGSVLWNPEDISFQSADRLQQMNGRELLSQDRNEPPGVPYRTCRDRR